MRTQQSKQSRHEPLPLHAGGPQYQRLRQGELFLPTFSTGFCRMLKALCAPSPADRPTPARILASSLLAKRSSGGGGGKLGESGGAKENKGKYGALALAPSQKG